MRITSLKTPLGTDVAGQDILVFRQIEGREALNALFEYELLAHSHRSDISAKELLGKPITVDVSDQNGVSRYLNAIVTEFTYVGSDNRRSLYRAKLAPWFSLATLSADCRIYQNVSVVDIVSTVLNKYPYPVKFKLADSYPKLTFCVQYNESDHAFVARMLERFGIGYHFAHTATEHTLVFTDQTSSFKVVSQHDSVPFRDGNKGSFAKEEIISHWQSKQAITSGTFATNDYFYRAPNAHLDQQSNGTSEPKNHDYDGLPVFHWAGQGYYSDWEQGDRVATVGQEEQEQLYQHVEAESNVRAFAIGASGHLFTLREHPQREMNQEVLIVGTHTLIKESAGSTGDGEVHGEWEVRLSLAPTKNKYRPQRVTPLPKIPGPQSAVVTGPSGQEAWTNDLGEIKVRFLWDRYSMGNENSSCWIRVCSPWADSTWGSVHIPRIGSEVIVVFLDGNPDHPLVVASVSNTSKLPASFSNTGGLPGNQTLAGFKSKEFNGGRYNQIVLDDTSQEIGLRLESEHAKSQVNLGYLVHPRNTSATARGEGFEVRTDAWGALRAARGMVISTEARKNAEGTAKSMPEATQRLTAAGGMHEEMTKLAEQFEAQKKGQQSEVGDVIKEQNSAIKGKDSGSIYPELSEPHLVLESPAGIETTTRKSTHISSEAHTALTTGKNLSIVTGDSFFASIRQAARIFVHKLGLKMIAAAGDIDIKALADSVNILAKLHITQTAETIKISASKEVLIDGGGSYTRWNAGGVEQGTSGSHTSHAGNHAFVGAKNVDVAHQKDFEKAKPKKYSQKLFVDEEIRNLASGPITYKFFSAANAALGSGTLDGSGKSQPLFTDTAQSVHVQVDVNGGKWTQLLDDRHESIPIPSTSQMIVFDYPEHGDGAADSDDADEDDTVEQA